MHDGVDFIAGRAVATGSPRSPTATLYGAPQQNRGRQAD